MNDIDQKSLALVERLRIIPDQNGLMYEDYEDVMQAADLIEQHESFRQEVSDAVVEYFGPKHLDVILAGHLLSRFIIPKPKPDPLVDVLHEVDTGPEWDSPEDYCNKIRAALEARGLEIREKGQ